MLADERFALGRSRRVEVALKALEMTQLRVVAAARNRNGKPDPASSILKIRGSEIQQTISELLMEAVGPYALPDAMPHDESERWNEPPIGPDWAGSCKGAALLQLAQGLVFRRVERDSEEHHRQGDPRTVGGSSSMTRHGAGAPSPRRGEGWGEGI